MQLTNKISRRWLAVSLAVGLGIFALGLVLPYWVRGGVAYIALVLIALWLPQRSATLILAVTGTVTLVVGEFYARRTTMPMRILVIHCSLWTAAIWATAALILSRRRAVEEKLRLFNLSRESQRFTERIVQAAPDLVYVYDLVEQRNVYVNRQVACHGARCP